MLNISISENRARLNFRNNLVLILIILVSGCETTEKIDDFPLRPSKLVVNCYFNPDSTWKVQVSKSLSVLDNADLKLIDNATVLLYEENSLIDSITNPDDDGWYRSPISLPGPGKQYTIEVSSPDHKEKTYASDELPVPVPIADTKFFIVDSFFSESPFHSYGHISGNLKIAFKDPGEINNFYQLKAYAYDSIFNYTNAEPEFLYVTKRSLTLSSKDPVLKSEGSYYGHFLFDDQLFNNKEISLNIDLKDYNPVRNKKVYIELTSLSRAGYLYQKTIEEYELARNDPFAEPVMIHSNIQNGFGIFAGYSSNTVTFIPF